MTETVTFPLETKITEPIAKRIRALKKRSNKKYDLTLELNEDQKQALAKQESLLLVIKELEDLQLALSNVEVKLAKESSLQLAALDERHVQDKNHLLELAGLVSTLPSLNKSHIDPELVSALFHVRSILVDSNNAAPVFTNLANKSSDLFHGFSFASLHQALLDIKNPPQIIPVKETKLNFFTSPVLDGIFN